MIEKVQPVVNYKLIRENAYVVTNLLKRDPKNIGVSAIYQEYLFEGAKAPGYASTIMKTAENDEFLAESNFMLKHGINVHRFEQYIRNLTDGFFELYKNNKEMIDKFNEAGKTKDLGD